MKARIGIVIINFRTPDLVINCLNSLAPQLELNDARVIVVDNKSDDGSAETIATFLEAGGAEKPSWKTRIALVRSRENSGFSGGNNLGLRFLDAKYYILLNSDTLVREGAIAALAAAATANPQAGIIGARLEDPNGTIQQSAFRAISPLSEFLSGAWLGVLDKIFFFGVVARPVPEKITHTDWVSFACVLITKEAQQSAGALDDRFFMYFEDADYCRSVRRAGFDVIYTPDAQVVHLRGGSSPVKTAVKNLKRPPAYFYASRTRYFRKRFGPLGHIAANIAWLTGRGLAYAAQLAGRKLPPVCDNISKDIWLNWRRPLSGDPYAPQSPANLN